MYALDTDTTSELARGRNTRLNVRFLAIPKSDIWLPAVVMEEQFRGRLAVLARLNPNIPRYSALIPIAYRDLVQTQTFLQRFQIVPYTHADEALYQGWPPAVKRLGTRDGRMAAIAVNNGLTIITRNTRHFSQIPAVWFEDWSV